MKKDLIIPLVATIVGAAACVSPTMAQTAAPVAPASQTAPASPAAAAMVTTVQKVCLPVLRGGDVKSIAAAAGYRLKDGAWVLTIDGERRIELQPPDIANPHICAASVYARPGSAAALRQALGAWAAGQAPPLTADAAAPSAPAQWTASSWSGRTSSGTLSVALGQEQAAPAQPGGSTSAGLAESDLLVSLTPA